MARDRLVPPGLVKLPAGVELLLDLLACLRLQPLLELLEVDEAVAVGVERLEHRLCTGAAMTSERERRVRGACDEGDEGMARWEGGRGGRKGTLSTSILSLLAALWPLPFFPDQHRSVV